MGSGSNTRGLVMHVGCDAGPGREGRPGPPCVTFGPFSFLFFFCPVFSLFCIDGKRGRSRSTVGQPSLTANPGSGWNVINHTAGRMGDFGMR